MSIGYTIVLVSIIFSAIFSGIEIAFVSANKLKIELDKSRNKLSGKILSWFNEREANFIGMLLIGNNIALVIYGIYMEKLLSPAISNVLPSIISIPIIILLTNTIISTLIILVFAEFIPKASFRLNANRALEIFSLPMLLIYFALIPFIFAFTKISEFVLRNIFRTKIENKKYQFSSIDFGHYIQEFHDETAEATTDIDNDIQIFRNALEFQNTKIRECMVPRTEINAIDKETEISKLIEIFHQSGHSKIPVYENNIDTIIGYVHAFDLIKKPKTISNILRDIEFIPESMTANSMLNKMIKEHISIAVVLDEFGGTSGIVTMEDLMEEIFGEIEDEFDKDKMIEKVLENNEYIFSARLEIDYLNETYDLGLKESEEYETLGGYITHYYENIPEKNTKIQIENKSFEILQAGNAKIDLIKIQA
jgi:CBS domain containing-hemolysin-like protein